MKVKKVTATLLLAAMLTSLAACGDAATETTAETTETAAVTETETTVDTDSIEGRKYVSDDLPEADFKGKEFNILSDDGNLYDIVADELNGDVVNDAVYNRMIAVNERFNTAIAHIDGGMYEVTSSVVKNAVQSGDDMYDLVGYHCTQMGIDTLNNIYLNWNDVPYINFDKPWWSKSTKEDLTYKNVTFLAFGELTTGNISSAGVMFYNKTMGDEYGLEDVYGLVKEGKWTKDKHLEMCRTVYVDTNGNGTRDREDKFGMAISLKNGGGGAFSQYGHKIYERQSDGTFKDVWYNEKLVSMVEFEYNKKNNEESIYTENAWNVEFDMFCAGNALFANTVLTVVDWGMRDLELDYAILPNPKWDEAQEGYYCCMGGSALAQAVLQSASDLEMVGVLTEALNAEGWKEVVPAYYDTTMKYKNSRDEQTIEMLDIIMEGRVFDFNYIYGGWDSPGFSLSHIQGTDVASYYASHKEIWDNYMASVFAVFEAYVK